MELFIYLLKASACTAAFYMVYYVLFRKLTFFGLNRWYLLVTLGISLCIPLLHIGIQTLIPAPEVAPLAINTVTRTVADMPDPVIIQQVAAPINWLHIANVVYLVIVGLLLLKFLVTLCGILYKAVKAGESQNGYRLVSSANNSSFFNIIFLNESGLSAEEKEQVIAHELIHVKKWHSVDNLFTGVVKAVLWFNPFVYLFAKALCQTHEFDVDRCLTDRYNSKEYAGLLLKLSAPTGAALTNQFSAYGLKSRIRMLFGKPSAAVKKLGYLLLMPITIGLVYFLAVEKVYAYDISNKNFVLVLDAGHGGKTGGARALNGMAEKDFNLVMVKQIKAVAEQRGIKTILTRTDDRDVPLKDRLIPQGDVFVSVHANSTPDKNSDLNGMMILTNKNENFEQSHQLAQAFIAEMKKLQGININDEVSSNQRIMVLRENKAPAILLELGYLTNKADFKYLLNKQNQHDIAEKFVDAIIAYKNAPRSKISGAVTVPGAIAPYTTSASPNVKPGLEYAKAPAIDTPVKSKLKATKADTTHYHLNFVTLGYSDSELKDGSIYKAFKEMRYTAKDSTRADNKNKALYLYNGNITSGRFSIQAGFIKYSQKDSLVFASGKVRILVNNKPDVVVMDVDSMRLDLRNHPGRKTVIKN